MYNFNGDFMSSVEEKIKDILFKIKPFLNNDGGDVEFVKYEDGIVYVKLLGNCADCALSDVTLTDMVESSLTFEIPEVIKVVNVNKAS
jgi:Fe-S cluster biogenesis protein NfuA